MVKRNSFVISTVLGLLALSGCGTVRNFNDPLPEGHTGFIVDTGGRQIYGGARSDLVGLYAMAGAEPVFILAGAYMLVVDLPLCLVGDTVTLPWTIQATRARESANLGFEAQVDKSSTPIQPNEPIRAPAK